MKNTEFVNNYIKCCTDDNFLELKYVSGIYGNAGFENFMSSNTYISTKVCKYCDRLDCSIISDVILFQVRELLLDNVDKKYYCCKDFGITRTIY
jgi:hypothetical protein